MTSPNNFPTLFFLSLFCFFNVPTFAQKMLPPEEGVDAFPVYKASRATSYIDSIVYTGDFIVFCVSFEAEVDERKYYLEGVNSKKSWMAHNGSGYKRPVIIRDIKSNGALLADCLKEKGLNIPLNTGTTTRVSCKFQFWRNDFQHNRAEIVRDLDRAKFSNAREVFFSAIRLRKSNYTHAVASTLNNYYKKNCQQEDLEKVKKGTITVNGNPINPSWNTTTVAEDVGTFQKVPYQVDRASEGKLLLEGVLETSIATIFRAQYKSKADSYLHLYHTKEAGFIIKKGNKKLRMQTIKNVRIDGKLVREEVKKGEIFSCKDFEDSFLITFDVHFERLPEDWKKFSLIEIFEDNSDSIAFSFYGIKALKN